MKIKLLTDRGVVEEYDSEVVPSKGEIIVFPHKGVTYTVNSNNPNEKLVTKHIVHSCKTIAVQMEIEISVKKVPHTVNIKKKETTKETSDIH